MLSVVPSSGSRYFGRFIRKYSKNVQDQVESQVIVEELCKV
jgi:hypothetical protein